MRRPWGWVIGCALGVGGTAWGQGPAVQPFNPGEQGSPPGTGCQVGTSGCYPSAPPGPITPPADYGATSEFPPPFVNPQNTPFYGELPGPAGDIQGILPAPTVEQALRVQAAEERQQRMQQLLEQQTQELQLQRDQLKSQTDELAAQRETIESMQDQAAQKEADAAGQSAATGTPATPVAPAASAPAQGGGEVGR
jgi:hypothetical protein